MTQPSTMYVTYCCVLIVFSVFTFASSATEDHKLNIFKLAKVRVRGHAERHDDEKRQKRSISASDETDITATMNNLRSSVGASNMNYMYYNRFLETDAADWTNNCDYDATVHSDTAVYGILATQGLPIDHVALLKQFFSTSSYYYGLSSVNLQYVGAGENFCTSARVNGTTVWGVYLAAYLFANTSSNFNDSYQQYVLGEQCTTCLSGSYWCYNGLCKGDCSSSDSNCYCNSYCLNCATTDATTCRCQCLPGWAGPLCQNQTDVNATAPMCSTTPRMLRTSTLAQTTIRSTQIKGTSGGVMNMLPIGKSVFQLVFYATIGLLFRS